MGYLPDAFDEHFRDDRHDRFGDVQLRYAVEDEPLGTAGGDPLRGRRASTSASSSATATCSPTSTSARWSRFHDERGAEATIALTQVDDPSRVRCRADPRDGEVDRVRREAAAGQAPSNWINAGTYVLEPSFLDRIPPRLNVSIERETFPRMLEQPGSPVRLPQRRVLARHRDAREVPRRRTPTCCAARVGRPPAPGARGARAGHLDRRATRRSTRARRSSRRCSSAPARASSRARACAGRCSAPARSSSAARCSTTRCCTTGARLARQHGRRLGRRPRRGA